MEPAGRYKEAVFELRQERGWSQNLLAVEVGVDPSTVSRWERAVMDPGGEHLSKMVQACLSGRTRAMFGLQPATRGLAKSAGEQWAHIAVEVIFERAPEAVQAKVIEMLETWAGKYGAPPSPLKPLAVESLGEEGVNNFPLDNTGKPSKMRFTSRPEVQGPLLEIERTPEGKAHVRRQPPRIPGKKER